ncbi:tonsoku-like protein [Tigriopus californicus]|uniref:tonsoku-like protein n=1 Tax=Tigriopus californicus TaxID=6832 RepID=UPI0027DAA235|nr:tonsoku-like protein [Tigriopus californicus]XP_059092512.1 tonsoku-like protein [Tigriopus californicus]|eukprot:TCALIF_00807-PA protein Name:"Similar to TONSL Tonsoku-like protein (Homo sapiens)" AED:0.00 eAED:0.00 QI:218/1/1/1/1/1/3/1501/1182
MASKKTKWFQDCRQLRQDKAQLFRAGKRRELALKAVTLAEALEVHGEHDEAIQEYQEAIENNETDRVFVARTKRKIGDACLMLQRYEAARSEFNHYLTMSLSLDLTADVQRAYTSLGRSYHDEAVDLHRIGLDDAERLNKFQALLQDGQKNFERAHQAIKQIVDPDCNEYERKEMEVIVVRNLLGIAQMREDTDKCSKLVELGERLCIERGSKFQSYLWTFKEIKLGLLVERGDIEAGIKLADQCLKFPAQSNTFKYHSLWLRSRLALKRKTFEDAHKFLYQAYKSMDKDDSQKEKLGSDLARVVKIRRLVSKFQALPINCRELEKSQLLEQIADKLCDCELFKDEAFETAVWYYKESLAHAEKCDGDQERLAALTSSIATTFFDLKDFKNALTFHEQELRLRTSGGKESIRCLIVMARCAQGLNKTYRAALTYLEKAIAIGKELEDKSLSAEVLLEIIELQSKHQMFGELKETKRELESLGNVVPNDGDSQETAANESDVSDLAYRSDNEDAQEGRTRRRRKFAIKTNRLGESPLHLASKKSDNVTTIQDLLDKGHPINHTDNSGFTPLHEAANHGQTDNIRVLLDNGANVNVFSQARITALMSACAVGVLPCIKLLLEAGAKVEPQDLDGWNAIDHLENTLKNAQNDVDPEERESCENIIRIMQVKLKAIEESGVNIRIIPKARKSRLFCTEDDSVQESKSISSTPDLGNRSRSQRRPLRERNTYRSGEENHSSESESNNDNEDGNLSMRRRGQKSSVTDYKSAIRALRPAQERNKIACPSPKKNPRFATGAYEDEFDNEDDWLEDDVGSSRLSSSSKRSKKAQLDTASRSMKSKQKKRRDPSNETRIKCEAVKKEQFRRDEEISQLSSPPTNASQFANQTLIKEDGLAFRHSMKVKVYVEKKSFMIPIMNLDWTYNDLSAEVARRYRLLTGKKPVLKLTTSDHSELLGTDLVSSVTNNNDELQSQILEWIVPPLVERYQEECQAKGVPEVATVTKAMKDLALGQAFGLSCFLRTPHTDLLFRALQWEDNLREITMPRCRLGEQGFNFLLLALPTLPNLERLNVKSNGISGDCIKSLVTKLKTSPALQCLQYLNLSFNPIGDDAADHLAELCLLVEALDEIELQACCLTSNVFLYAQPKWKKVLPRYKSINLGCNFIDGPGQSFVRNQVPLHCRVEFCHK